jgi:hypothetical protein
MVTAVAGGVAKPKRATKHVPVALMKASSRGALRRNNSLPLTQRRRCDAGRAAAEGAEAPPSGRHGASLPARARALRFRACRIRAHLHCRRCAAPDATRARDCAQGVKSVLVSRLSDAMLKDAQPEARPQSASRHGHRCCGA